jgi:hypothetical protein
LDADVCEEGGAFKFHSQLGQSDILLSMKKKVLHFFEKFFIPLPIDTASNRRRNESSITPIGNPEV